MLFPQQEKYHLPTTIVHVKYVVWPKATMLSKPCKSAKGAIHSLKVSGGQAEEKTFPLRCPTHAVDASTG